MERKRIVSLVALIFTVAAVMLSLVSCGGEKLKGIELYCEYETYYNSETDSTDVSVMIDATNGNQSHIVRGYKYKILFKDSTGYVMSSRVFTANTNGVMPGTYDRFFHDFSESDGTAIRGNIYMVDVIPVEMTLDDEEVKDSDSGSTEWTFWTWLWVIISGVLVYLFFTVCSQEDWDSDTVIGGVVIFLVPAAIILIVYFGFFFGH